MALLHGCRGGSRTKWSFVQTCCRLKTSQQPKENRAAVRLDFPITETNINFTQSDFL
jgi:hypothetical protein